jgi:hypothetical protein
MSDSAFQVTMDELYTQLGSPGFDLWFSVIESVSQSNNERIAESAIGIVVDLALRVRERLGSKPSA